MKVDGTLGGLETAAGQARDAEAAGYDGVWTGEVSSDPFLPLAVATPATSRIALGTSIAVALSRSPMSLAYTANDLQRFSGGRFSLGLGSQVKAHITRRFSMPWGRPAAQMREFVLAMRAAWSCWAEGSPLAFEGEYYQHTLMPPAFVPAAHPFGPPRVLLAGVGDVMTRVAGEVADGFFCHWFTTPRWIREHTIPALAEGRRRAGATLDGFDIVVGGFVATGTEEEITTGLARMRSQIAFYASTPAYRAVLELHGWGELGIELTMLSKQNRWAEMAALIDEDVVDAFGIVADPADVPARVGERYGHLATRLTFNPPASFTPEQVQETIAAIQALPGTDPAALTAAVPASGVA
ncbi:TIGR03617 family F420-dependent LLM class oxidoreductase [Frankia sp. CNm7]|uniref:TIGR03617 family F420-dependent LLM class oxidoreductase n=1 Tax=Frankia nepalensis TaxID=1836974 RepID=A0A937RBT9_9ACTN|nr:TIGR03617 family F420-dependent LLM class oxidoreductase [Frankia nepalensis]MBL7495457.1 TIGR03617 family F420-dependent LLM class oxidoreductase [Frankia nepalensis]MBL7510712.1 TIGR03617 family F420-dependent LLM class oxidoreductase [Frankia nepalensis]MBL7521675.1 TIGR03617 family F420-dependent LLM class oxidoreductase [Frankia nepalensis]MBL7626014.1 TIGR03617 family F420-dependent LLM class oxidoreductase [Frankia nepalensis]